MGDPSWLTPWLVSDGWPALARYASKNCLPPSLQPANRDSEPDEVLDSVLARLVDKQLWYSNPQWWAGRGQMIRDPDTMLATQAGTCLDVALLVVSMVISHSEQPDCEDLWPMLAVGTRRRGSWHAFVIVAAEPVVDGHIALNSTQFAELAELAPYAADPSLLLRAGAQPVSLEDVRDAREAARQHLDPHHSVFTELHLVDVRSSHLVHPPLPPDPGRPRAVYEVLPPSSGCPDLVSWQVDFTVRPGVTVLLGESGSGKSTAALAAAERAQNGAGWFLQAETPATLQRSLGRAEVRSDPRLGAASRGDRPQMLAANALERLREVAQPWVVILDGADGDPQAYEPFIPQPDPGEGQCVVIATSNREWLDWARPRGAHCVEVPADAPNQLVRVLGGTPGEGLEPAVRGALVGLSPDLIGDLCAIAWMPPADVAQYLLPATPALTLSAEEALVGRGLLDEATGIVPRGVRNVLRADSSLSVDWDLLNGLLTANSALVRSYSDRGYFESLFVRLGDAQVRAAVSARTALLLAVARDHVDLGSDMAAQILAEVGWVDGEVNAVLPWARALAFECLESLSRAALRQRDIAVLPECVRWAEQGLELADDTAQRSHLRELWLLGIRGLAEAEADVEKLWWVLRELEQIVEMRSRLPAGHPDIDVALYNLPGTRLRLSKLVGEPQRSDLLDRALAEFEQVLEMRQQYLGDAEVEDIATCYHGIGRTKYHQAARGRTLTSEDRVRLLSEAAEALARALRIRCRWVGAAARPAQQSAQLLVKVAALESVLVGAGEPEGKVAEMRRQWGG